MTLWNWNPANFLASSPMYPEKEFRRPCSVPCSSAAFRCSCARAFRITSTGTEIAGDYTEFHSRPCVDRRYYIDYSRKALTQSVGVVQRKLWTVQSSVRPVPYSTLGLLTIGRVAFNLKACRTWK